MLMDRACWLYQTLVLITKRTRNLLLYIIKYTNNLPQYDSMGWLIKTKAPTHTPGTGENTHLDQTLQDLL